MKTKNKLKRFSNKTNKKSNKKKTKKKSLNKKQKGGSAHKFITDQKNRLNIYEECKFFNNSPNDEEVGECSVAHQIIPLVKNVIEFGGGSGKVSNTINNLLKDNTQHIVMEPAPRFSLLMDNRRKLNNKYLALHKNAEDLTYKDLEILKEKPDCLFIDCEGCLLKFLNTDIGKYILNNVRFIVNEMDGNNEALRKLWSENNFTKIGTGYGCGSQMKCDTEVWFRET
jgi:hypothetical protein